jgi:hypothetical protein
MLRYENYIHWVQRKQPGHKVSVAAWVESRLDCHANHCITVYPKEVRVTHRNAWTDTHDTDERLGAFIGQVQRQISAGETLDIRLCPHRKAEGECLKAFTSAEECQKCTRCPDCCDCKEGR